MVSDSRGSRGPQRRLRAADLQTISVKRKKKYLLFEGMEFWRALSHSVL